MTMIIIFLMKFFYVVRIQIEQNINILFKNMKKMVSKSMKIQRIGLNTQTICRVSIQY